MLLCNDDSPRTHPTARRTHCCHNEGFQGCEPRWWRELVHGADAIDDYVSDPKLLALERAKDTEARWEDLLDDPRWQDHLGHGSQWSFLDPIGFRYYLAPAMIQALRWPASFDFSFRLTVTDDYVLNQLKLLDPEQCRCARDFVLFMRDLGVQTEAYHDADTWQEAYDSHWYQF